MAGNGKRYTKEFKDSAIQLALNSEKSVMQIARELGVSVKTLYRWLQDYRKKYSFSENGCITLKPSSSESLQEENRCLRRELANLKKEREILKKAAAYFAKETM